MNAATDNVRSAMAESGATSSQPPRSSPPSYLVAGVLFYGAVGHVYQLRLHFQRRRHGLEMLGGGLGTYMMIVQLQRQTSAEQAHASNKTSNKTSNEESE